MQIIENAVYMGAATPGTGGAAVIDTLNVTPSTSAQTITAPEGTDGYSPVNVSAVTSSIDANIVAGNIKKDVQILGVTGSYEGNVPTGTMYIISNGTYNVADKAIADVQVPTTAPAHYIEKTKNNNGMLVSGPAFINLNGVTSIGSSVLMYAFYGNTNITTADMSSITSISNGSACAYMCSFCSNLVSLDLSSLTSINTANNIFVEAFRACSKLANVNLSALTEIRSQSGCSNMFQDCTALSTIDLSSLKRVSGQNCCNNMFYKCTNLTSADLSSLEYAEDTTSTPFNHMFDQCTSLTSLDARSFIGGVCTSMFQSFCYACTSLTTVRLDSLKHLKGSSACSGMFYNCTSLKVLNLPAINNYTFGSYTNQFSGMLTGTSDCVVHFPKNLDPQGGSTKISGLSGYPTFGGTNTVLMFDLPSTLFLTGANSKSYERSPKDDTPTALAWRKGDINYSSNIEVDWTPFYTSTTNDPQVGDTIYSDAACTTAVTTISSIA